MRLKILAEGSTKWQRFIKRWGLSILIDDDVLFDTFGKPDYVAGQLKKINADFKKIKHIVISHDDWDHVAGLWKILEQNQDTTVYICPGFKQEIKAKIKWYGARISELKDVTNIRGDIYSSGELAFRQGDCGIPEQYLAVRTAVGAVIITGCAHPGIIGIIRHARENIDERVRLVAGGFHLKDNTADEIRATVSEFKKLGVGQVMPMHCTGRAAQSLLLKEYGQNCVIPDEGQTIEI